MFGPTKVELKDGQDTLIDEGKDDTPGRGNGSPSVYSLQDLRLYRGYFPSSLFPA